MSDQPFAIARGQVLGINAALGTCTVGVMPAGNGIVLSHVIACGNATTGLHWMPSVGDWLLISYEPGMQPQILCPLLDRTQAGMLTPPLAPGELRITGPLNVTGVITAQGHSVIEADSSIGSGAPAAATHYLRITLDGITWWRLPLTPD